MGWRPRCPMKPCRTMGWEDLQRLLAAGRVRGQGPMPLLPHEGRRGEGQRGRPDQPGLRSHRTGSLRGNDDLVRTGERAQASGEPTGCLPERQAGTRHHRKMEARMLLRQMHGSIQAQMPEEPLLGRKRIARKLEYCQPAQIAL